MAFKNVKNVQLIRGFMLSSGKMEVIWCNLIKLNQLDFQNHSSESHTRFFIYEKLSQENEPQKPKVLRNC